MSQAKRSNSLSIMVWLTLAWGVSNVFAQGVGGGQGGTIELPPSDDPPQTGYTITITISPDAEVPLGEEVTLTATVQGLDVDATYWERRCNSPVDANHPIEWEHPTCWQEVPSIKLDCGEIECPAEGGTAGNPAAADVASVGEKSYRYVVEHHTPGIPSPVWKTVKVNWNKPNKYKLTFHPPKKFPGIGSPANVAPGVQQDIDVCLFWNDKPLGPCAAVCCQEHLSLFYFRPLNERLQDRTIPNDAGNDPTKSKYWKPKNEDCAYEAEHVFMVFPSVDKIPDPQAQPGQPAPPPIPRIPSFFWKSPCLTDVHIGPPVFAEPPIGPPPQLMNNFVNKKVGRMTRRYRFSGPICPTGKNPDGTEIGQWTGMTPEMTWDLILVKINEEFSLKWQSVGPSEGPLE
jgi:hypothetical protein